MTTREYDTCVICRGKVVLNEKTKYVEVNSVKGTHHTPGTVAETESQGCFPVGPDCAKVLKSRGILAQRLRPMKHLDGCTCSNCEITARRPTFKGLPGPIPMDMGDNYYTPPEPPRSVSEIRAYDVGPTEAQLRTWVLRLATLANWHTDRVSLQRLSRAELAQAMDRALNELEGK